MGVPNRIVVVDTLNWIPGESGQGQSVDARFVRWLETEKDPCGPRNFKAGTEWQPVDLGWLKGEAISYLHFANLAGIGLLVNPGKEEKDKITQSVLQVAVSPGLGAVDSPLLVRPGANLRIEVANPASVQVRCLAGECKYALTVFPN